MYALCIVDGMCICVCVCVCMCVCVCVCVYVCVFSLGYVIKSSNTLQLFNIIFSIFKSSMIMIQSFLFDGTGKYNAFK